MQTVLWRLVYFSIIGFVTESCFCNIYSKTLNKNSCCHLHWNYVKSSRKIKINNFNTILFVFSHVCSQTLFPTVNIVSKKKSNNSKNFQFTKTTNNINKNYLIISNANGILCRLNLISTIVFATERFSKKGKTLNFTMFRKMDKDKTIFFWFLNTLEAWNGE